MENQPCTKPRSANVAHGALLASIFALAAGTTGCGIVIPEPGCPNLSELCPNLECADGYVTDDDGCFICECQGEEPPPPPTVCWDDSECGEGQRCDLENFCETPPGCDADQPCPAVCYGRCVDAPRGCASDADCGEGEICRFGEPVPAPEARPAEPDETDPNDGDVDNGGASDPALCAEEDPNCGGMPPPPVDGVCVPADCANEDRLAFPACPPGTEPFIDFVNDPCGEVRCIAVDDCRNLDPDTCAMTPGCHLEEIAGGCGGEPGPDGNADEAAPFCDPVVELICVPDAGGDCRDLGPEECELNPDCYGEWYAIGCAEPVDCADQDCLVACDPIDEFVCLPRTNDVCYSDYDCGPGQRCELEWTCVDICVTTSDGGTECWGECYTGEGHCVEDTTSCYELPPELCEQDPRCMLESYDTPEPGTPDAAPCYCDPDGNCDCGGPVPVCVPRPTQTCYSDWDCGYGQRCELNEYCPPCADGDPACLAPCFVEGVCVDVGPGQCSDGTACPPGHACEVVVVCESCGGGAIDPTDPNGAPPPEDCIGICYEETVCVPVNNGDRCYSDADCGDGGRCNIDLCLPDPSCPECDVCTGICEYEPIGDVCWTDADCGGNQICNTWDYCEVPGPDMPGGLIACLGRCEELPPPPVGCLENADCGAGQRCATELDLCYCPDGACTFDQPCFSICVDVEEGAMCYADEECGNGQLCFQTDQACLDPNGGVVACPGICLFDGEPPPPVVECFEDADCAEGELCEIDPSCAPGELCSRCVPNDVTCIQVEQAAINPADGQCAIFPTPCDVPADWELVDSCG